MQAEYRIAIHGGSGNIDRQHLGEGRAQRRREALRDIVSAAAERLRDGTSALDACEHAVRLLEDCDYFNAGRGSVLNRDGEVEMDAAIMDGQDRRCGAVAAIRKTRHPVALARRVMEASEHIMLVGPAADDFAATAGLEQVEQEFLITAHRRAQLAAAARAGGVSLDHDESYGTVGAVALDCRGHLAAATSTGGMNNQLPGRVGDSPLIGSGTWADDSSCAVSGTGHGEHFIRALLGYDIHCRIAYLGQSLAQASERALAAIGERGGGGGLIAVDRQGRLSLPFNVAGMYRAWVAADGRAHAAVFRDD